MAAGNKSMPKSPNFLSSQSSSPYHESLEGLNNMGNMECRRASFLDAISFYDKAIALCPQNAACHNNKAASFEMLSVEIPHQKSTPINVFINKAL